MMKPTPSTTTANMTSAKLKPRRRFVSRMILISFTSHQRAVVAVDRKHVAILVEPSFFGLFVRAVCTGAIRREVGVHIVVGCRASAGRLDVVDPFAAVPHEPES